MPKYTTIKNTKRQKIKRKIKNRTIKNNENNNIKHKVLGNSSTINLLKEKYNRIKKKINIKKYSNKNSKINIIANTIPHAGFEYSGLHALFAIDEVIKYNSKEITILWFQHNPNSNEEHSLENVRKLVKLLKPTIKIHNIMISSNTKLSDINLKIKGGLLISTDFSHHNNGNPDYMDKVWLNDQKNFISDTGEIKPCGNNPLRILKEFVKKNNLSVKLLCYSNSQDKEIWWNPLKKDLFNGVTYASLGCFISNENWLLNLDSKLLAYSHLKWVEQFLNQSNNIINNGLYWSPLNQYKGSSFVTISDFSDKTLSCFGYWEDINDINNSENLENSENNILNCIKQASLSVKTASWNGRQSINLNNLMNYKISITLIEPIKNWEKIGNIRKKGKGYVYMKNGKVGMTYLPSVWKLFMIKSNFFKNLKKKQTDHYSDFNDWELYSYNSISWTLDS